ncbi:MAG: cytochrome c maturation protein CcmE [Proteobacteria bacterium]|nr:cytochrome c maturation protein CcmE [Pseudomonadota bacterium]
MALLPRSKTARRRLMIAAAVAPVLALAVGLTLYGLRGSISYFYTPAQAAKAHVPSGRSIQLGGLVSPGSVVKHGGGEVDFTVADRTTSAKVVYRGDLPDLFREGQGVVATGSFNDAGVFQAKQVLAKHDEKYMPPELAKALKEQGEWRGSGAAAPTYGAPPPAPSPSASPGSPTR